MSDGRKALRIKTGVLKRLHKEIEMYTKEADKHRAKIDEMHASNVDAYDIKKMGEVLDETAAMVPDTQRRLERARAEMADLLEAETALASSEEYKAAKSMYDATAV